jgi:hypothetical protein
MIYYLAFYDYEIRLHTHREDIDEEGLLYWWQFRYEDGKWHRGLGQRSMEIQK